MARRSGFVSTMNAVARDAARRQRQAEVERKRQERLRVQEARNADRAQKLSDKENSGILKHVSMKRQRKTLNLPKH
jgi:hypothetical protein